MAEALWVCRLWRYVPVCARGLAGEGGGVIRGGGESRRAN